MSKLSIAAYALGASLVVSVIVAAFFWGEAGREKTEKLHAIAGASYLSQDLKLCNEVLADQDTAIRGLGDANTRLQDLVTELEARPPTVVHTCTESEPKIPDAPIPYLELRGVY